MKDKLRWATLALWFVVIPIWVWLAWGGSKFAIIGLAGVAVFFVVMYHFVSIRWTSTLAGWEFSNHGWEAAQKWGAQQDQILRDALEDLSDYDSEAAGVHAGRALNANIEYVGVLDTEDVVNAVLEARHDRNGNA